MQYLCWKLLNNVIRPNSMHPYNGTFSLTNLERELRNPAAMPLQFSSHRSVKENLWPENKFDLVTFLLSYRYEVCGGHINMTKKCKGPHTLGRPADFRDHSHEISREANCIRFVKLRAALMISRYEWCLTKVHIGSFSSIVVSKKWRCTLDFID